MAGRRGRARRPRTVGSASATHNGAGRGAPGSAANQPRSASDKNQSFYSSSVRLCGLSHGVCALTEGRFRPDVGGAAVGGVWPLTPKQPESCSDMSLMGGRHSVNNPAGTQTRTVCVPARSSCKETCCCSSWRFHAPFSTVNIGLPRP